MIDPRAHFLDGLSMGRERAGRDGREPHRWEPQAEPIVAHGISVYGPMAHAVATLASDRDVDYRGGVERPVAGAGEPGADGPGAHSRRRSILPCGPQVNVELPLPARWFG